MIVPDEIHRSARKTLSISVDATGRLIVRAPLRCSEARIYAFIEKKSDWITLRMKRAENVRALLPTKDLEGFQFLLEGKICTIRLVDSKRTKFDEEAKVLYLPKTGGENAIVKFLKKRAKEVFLQNVEYRAMEMKARYKQVCVSSAKKRWGSCALDGTLRISFHLLYAPPAVIDYVIVHELAHVFHRNHGKAFWAMVGLYCPDWKIKRKWLKDHAYLMEIF